MSSLALPSMGRNLPDPLTTSLASSCQCRAEFGRLRAKLDEHQRPNSTPALGRPRPTLEAQLGRHRPQLDDFGSILANGGQFRRSTSPRTVRDTRRRVA